MTDKAYIVANKKQELDVLNKFEKEGLKWRSNRNPTEFFPSDICLFPIVLFKGDCITWSYSVNLNIEEIVYDGRKEEKMYKVTQEFMNELIKWRDQRHLDMGNESYYATFKHQDLRALNGIVMEWQFEEDNPIERNNRLIAIIQWLNGEDVFEVEAQHKFVVRNDTLDYDGDYYYVQIFDGVTDRAFSLDGATRFDTREEAQEWANSHQVVVEIDAEGNEVE